jgi:predicted ribosome-associated RNA-binding protein Tma20
VRCNRVKNTLNKINIQKLIATLKTKRTNKKTVSYTQRKDQIIIVGKSVIHFQHNSKGLGTVDLLFTNNIILV